MIHIYIYNYIMLYLHTYSEASLLQGVLKTFRRLPKIHLWQGWAVLGLMQPAGWAESQDAWPRQDSIEKALGHRAVSRSWQIEAALGRFWYASRNVQYATKTYKQTLWNVPSSHLLVQDTHTTAAAHLEYMLAVLVFMVLLLLLFSLLSLSLLLLWL